MKSISILGSTGSIGTQTLDVIRRLPGEFKVVGLTANTNIDLLEKQIKEFKPISVAVANQEKADELKNKVDTTVYSGATGINKIASLQPADTIVNALVGFIGLIPTIKAINHKKDIALANKETLVAGGSLVIKALKKYKVNLIPIDSEHSAIFQCLNTEKINSVERLIITASGGPFLNYKKSDLERITPKQALRHPIWRMGERITIDSATLMNKGFEVIEAMHLFNLPLSKIETIIHPQSIIHSAVEFIDGSVIAQLGIHDMRIPIQFALTYPKRINLGLPKLNLADIGIFTFKKVDKELFPCLGYAYEAASLGGTMPAVLNASDEVAVQYFLEKRIKFLDIPKIVRSVMNIHKIIKSPDLKDILKVDKWARVKAKNNI